MQSPVSVCSDKPLDAVVHHLLLVTCYIDMKPKQLDNYFADILAKNALKCE